MAKYVASGILADGTEWDGIPITLADRLAWEKAARANGWTADKNPVSTDAFLSFYAARRAGALPAAMNWKEFTDQAIDAATEAPEAEAGEAADLDPTPPADS